MHNLGLIVRVIDIWKFCLNSTSSRSLFITTMKKINTSTARGTFEKA